MPGRVSPLQMYMFLTRARPLKGGVDLDAFHQLRVPVGQPNKQGFDVAKMLTESTAPIVNSEDWTTRRAQELARKRYITEQGPDPTDFGFMRPEDSAVYKMMKLRQSFDSMTSGPYGLRSEFELGRDDLQMYLDSLELDRLQQFLNEIRMKRTGGHLD